jgi:hypothetical protein
MEKVLKHFQTAIVIKANIIMENQTGSVNIIGEMEHIMKEHLWMGSGRVLVNGIKTQTLYIKDNFYKIKNMVMGFNFTKTEIIFRENFAME